MTGQHMAGMPAAEGNAHLVASLLQATLQANRITALVGLAWDGPQLWAFSCTLGLGEQPERAERLAGALALAAGADSCRVARQGGAVAFGDCQTGGRAQSPASCAA